MARQRSLWLCVVGALVAFASASQITVNQASSNPHVHKTLPFQPVRPREQQPALGDPFPTVTVDLLNVTGRYAVVNVTWNMIDFTGKSDYLALYADSMNFGTNSPIEFKYTSTSGSWAPENGSVTFTLINRRTNYYFVYVSGAAQFPEEKARSSVFSVFPNLYEPLQGHLSLVPGQPSNIQVMWNQKSIVQPVVKVGIAPGSYQWTFQATNMTYAPSDLCDQDISPAATMGWLEPGYFLTAQLTGMKPNQVYYYVYGDNTYGFSQESSFQAPPAPGAPTDGTVRIFAFGDMGQAPIDGAWQHSWDFNDRGEYPALNTTALIGNLTRPGDAILHIGDISYAVGYLSEWDQFMTQIEPVASRNIWQTGIGNHEFGWTQSFFGPPADSGGECGVPYNVRFPFFQNSSNPSATPAREWLPWYSFDYGPVHIIVTSTEHNFTAGTNQHNFVVQDLATLNRSATPWVIFTGHRPMYPDSTYSGDIQVSQMLQAAFEDLLIQYNVSLALYGHQHAYSRTCPIYNGTCVSKGPIHMVIGMAGYSLTKNPATPTPPYINFHADDFYGVIRITVFDDHHACVDTIATNGTVVDMFEIFQ